MILEHWEAARIFLTTLSLAEQCSKIKQKKKDVKQGIIIWFIVQNIAKVFNSCFDLTTIYLQGSQIWKWSFNEWQHDNVPQFACLGNSPSILNAKVSGINGFGHCHKSKNVTREFVWSYQIWEKLFWLEIFLVGSKK